MRTIAVILCLTTLLGCPEHAQHEAAPSAAGGNPVQNEMKLLSTALEGAVRRIGQGDVRPVEHDLHRVHAAKEATEKALHGGQYRLPKNPDQVERFHTLDEAFHRDLERLVHASQQNDVDAAAKALGELIQSCQGCHSQFRK